MIENFIRDIKNDDRDHIEANLPDYINYQGTLGLLKSRYRIVKRADEEEFGTVIKKGCCAVYDDQLFHASIVVDGIVLGYEFQDLDSIQYKDNQYVIQRIYNTDLLVERPISYKLVHIANK